jgi:hypothetical protein
MILSNEQERAYNDFDQEIFIDDDAYVFYLAN